MRYTSLNRENYFSKQYNDASKESKQNTVSVLAFKSQKGVCRHVINQDTLWRDEDPF